MVRSTTLPDQGEGEWIDLATVLRLAGADNIEVEAVRAKVDAARADLDAATALFFPSLSIGAGYLRHDGRLQDTSGDVFDVSKSSLAGGSTVRIAIDPATAHFERLRAKQLLEAALYREQRTRAEAVVRSAVLYLDLLLSRARLALAEDALARTEALVSLSQETVKQRAEPRVHLARALAELARDKERVIRARSDYERASVDLAVWLRLPPETALVPSDDRVQSIRLVDADTPAAELVDQALRNRPDLKELQALQRAAEAGFESTRWSPWIPRLDVFAGYGGLGGGPGSSFGDFGDRGDYGATLTWTFDFGQEPRRRRAAAEMREAAVRVRGLEEAIAGAVIRALADARALEARIVAARAGVDAAVEALELATARFEVGDALQLEVLDAARQLAESRLELVRAVIHFNRTQYTLHYLVDATVAQ